MGLFDKMKEITQDAWVLFLEEEESRARLRELDSGYRFTFNAYSIDSLRIIFFDNRKYEDVYETVKQGELPKEYIPEKILQEIKNHISKIDVPNKYSGDD